jgi:hypothetical protein
VTPRIGRSHMVGRGKVGTGEYAHAWTFELRDLCERHSVEVPDPGTAHGRAVVAALGARINHARAAA